MNAIKLVYSEARKRELLEAEKAELEAKVKDRKQAMKGTRATRDQLSRIIKDESWDEMLDLHRITKINEALSDQR